MSALGRISALSNIQLAITDVVLAESVGARKRAAQEALADLQSAVSNASKVFRDADLNFYLPDAELATQSWEDELRRYFVIVQTDGYDAVEALTREALRIAPAKPTEDGSATGARDASIWLTVRRLAARRDVSVVYFVSGNTQDFAAKGKEEALRKELIEELVDPGRVLYASSLGNLISLIANQVNTEKVDDAAIASAIGEENWRYELYDMIDASDRIRDRSWLVLNMRHSEAKELRRYEVEGTQFAMLEAQLQVDCELSGEDKLETLRFEGRLRLWSQSEGLISRHEVERVISLRADD